MFGWFKKQSALLPTTSPVDYSTIVQNVPHDHDSDVTDYNATSYLPHPRPNESMPQHTSTEPPPPSSFHHPPHPPPADPYPCPSQSTLRALLSRSTSPVSSNLSLLSSDISEILSDLFHLPDDFRHSPPGSFPFVETIRVPKSAYEAFEQKLEDLEQKIAAVAEDRQDLLTRLFTQQTDINVKIDIDVALKNLLDLAAQDAIEAAELDWGREIAARRVSEARWNEERTRLHQWVAMNTYLMLNFFESSAKEREALEILEQQVEEEKAKVKGLEDSLAVVENENSAAKKTIESLKAEADKLKARFDREKDMHDKLVRALNKKIGALEEELADYREEEEEARREEEEEEAREREERARKESERKEREHKKKEKEQEERRKKEAERRRKAREEEERQASVPQEWLEYETFWETIHGLLGRPNQTFASIRWPMIVQPDTPDDIKVDKIKKFILSPLHSAKRPHKQRIKDALLRWHPDKFQRVLEKVKPGEREKVLLGADFVVKHLNAILEKV